MVFDLYEETTPQKNDICVYACVKHLNAVYLALRAGLYSPEQLLA